MIKLGWLKTGFALVAAFCLSIGATEAQDQPQAPAQDQDQAPAQTKGAIPPGLIGKRVTLADFGSEDTGYLVLPKTPPSLGIILVPDAYGLDNFTLGEADELSKMGYIVLAVDTYNGQVTSDNEKMHGTADYVNQDAMQKTIIAAIRLFHESPRYRAPHVAAVGWGVGAQAIVGVTHQQKSAPAKTLETAILFYPSLECFGKPKSTKTRICALFPTLDPQFPHDNVLTVQKKMRSAGNQFDAWFIEAGERWSNPSSHFYNALEDGEAWKVGYGYLQQAATGPAVPENQSIVDKIKHIF